ncbi:MAG: uroporphyrinogen decarboxylase [Nonlabens sp.]
MTDFTVELLGYAASGLVLLSFLMKNIKTLRMVNCLGCLFFVFYGFLLSNISVPIIITNVAIICVNLYYLLLKDKSSDTAKKKVG